MTATYTIEPLVPMALLDVNDVYTNEYWCFCPDNTTDVDGRFLEDSELTYDLFDLGPDAILPAGTTVVMPYLWGWRGGDVGGMTSPVDYEITLPKAATVSRIVHIILSQYYAAQEVQDAGGRFYFIEGVTQREDGKVEIVWGT
jgi:hypothetical protein